MENFIVYFGDGLNYFD